MISQSILLANWSNGVFMIGIFALVVIALVAVPILLMRNDKKKKGDSKE